MVELDDEESALSPERALQIIFDGAETGDHLIGFATIRPTSQDPDPHTCAYAPALWHDQESVQRIRGSQPEGLFFSPNRFHRSSARKRDLRFQGSPIWFTATKANVAEVRAIVLDVDVGRPDDPDPRKRALAEDAALAISRSCAAGRLPEPTMLIYSGRGLYLLYAIRDESGRSALAPTVEVQQSRLHIIDELCRRIEELGIFVDVGHSKMVQGWFKVPGTRDPKTGRTVTAHLFSNLPTHQTLDSLTAALLNSLVPNDPTTFLSDPEDAYAVMASQRRSKGEAPKRRTAPGQAAYPNIVRAREIERIVFGRAGRMDGHRHMTLFHYAAAVYRAHAVIVGDAAAKEIANREARTLNATFTQPLLENEVENALRSNWWIPSRNDTVFSDLGVTMNEVEAHALSSLIPPQLRRERNARRRYTTMSRKALRHTVESFRIYLLGKGYSYRRIAEATHAAEDTIKRLKARTFGARILEKKQIDGTVLSDLEGLRDDDFDGDDGA